jgi:hypothetical protein
MDHPKGAGETGNVRLDFDRQVRPELHESKISSDGGLLLFRELDEILGLHDIAGGLLRDERLVVCGPVQGLVSRGVRSAHALQLSR